MPDEWEQQFSFDPQDPSNGPEDKDGDAYTNREEYLDGNDPTVCVDYTKPDNNISMLDQGVALAQ